MADLPSYLYQVSRHVANQDGTALARMMTLPTGSTPLTPDMLSLVTKLRGSSNIVGQCESRVSGGLGTMAGNRLAALLAVAESDWAEANRCSIAMYNGLLAVFREDDAGWLIPVVNAVSNAVRVLATEVRCSRMHYVLTSSDRGGVPMIDRRTCKK